MRHRFLDAVFAEHAVASREHFRDGDFRLRL
jgi:hypothetical protein